MCQPLQAVWALPAACALGRATCSPGPALLWSKAWQQVTLGRQTREHGPALPPSARGGLKQEETPPPGRGRRTEQLRNRTQWPQADTARRQPPGPRATRGQREAPPGPSACLERGVGRGWTHRAPPPPSTRAMVFPVSTRARREKSECRSGGFWKSRSYISTWAGGQGWAPRRPCRSARNAGCLTHPVSTPEGPRAAPKGHEAQTSAESPPAPNALWARTQEPDAAVRTCPSSRGEGQAVRWGQPLCSPATQPPGPRAENTPRKGPQGLHTPLPEAGGQGLWNLRLVPTPGLPAWGAQQRPRP